MRGNKTFERILERRLVLSIPIQMLVRRAGDGQIHFLESSAAMRMSWSLLMLASKEKGHFVLATHS